MALSHDLLGASFYLATWKPRGHGLRFLLPEVVPIQLPEQESRESDRSPPYPFTAFSVFKGT